jgi:hypothetical protein
LGLGISPTSLDVDADGVLNAAELAQGTSPFDPDSDDDGADDAADCYPLDATLLCPTAQSGDEVPPRVTLIEPSAALISSVPPQ